MARLTMQLSARHYGLRTAKLLAWVMVGAGVSEATAMRAARWLIVVRIQAGPRSQWLWLGRA